MKEKLTQERLKEILHYDPDTGLFTRIKNKKNVGSKNALGYLTIFVLNKQYLSHRLAWLYIYGYFPETDIDHIDQDKANNKLSNIRVVSRQCNMRNTHLQANNTSGIKGVAWHKPSNRWMVRIKVNKKELYLGLVKYKNDAAKLRWEAEKKYGFPNCNTTSSAYKYLKENGCLK